MTDKEKKCEEEVCFKCFCECKGTCPHTPPQESEENWETQFRNKFFVYKLGGKHPDHVGAEKEAIAFIADLVVKNFDQGYQKGKMDQQKIYEEWDKRRLDILNMTCKEILQQAIYYVENRGFPSIGMREFAEEQGIDLSK